MALLNASLRTELRNVLRVGKRANSSKSWHRSPKVPFDSKCTIWRRIHPKR